MLFLFLLIALLLLAFNAFFVLAEFAAVKMRPTRVQELVDQGNGAARVFQHIQSRLDEYLSVCQVGITFASIGLGFVAEPSIARLVEPLIRWAGDASVALAHSIAVTVAYLIVSFLHILLGELVPKSVAIRAAERSALWTARPLRFFHILFYVPLMILNGCANLLLRAAGLPPKLQEEAHSERELKLLLARSQATGCISFRKLLFIENIFDLEGVKVRHAMKPASAVKVLRLSASEAENDQVVRKSRFSRYPLMDDSSPLPIGIVHIKDLYYGRQSAPDFRKMARPYVTAGPDDDLEQLLAELQRRRSHLAIVAGSGGEFVGLITLEDVIEEIIGTIEDEFEVETPWSVADALSAARVILGVQAGSIEAAIRGIVARVPASQLPMPGDRVVELLLDRERVMSTYLGSGLALPHARVDGLPAPVILLGRSEEGVPAREEERAHLFFTLLTPTNNPRSQVRLLARIASMMDSEFVREKLRTAGSPQDVLDAIRHAEVATMR